MPQVHSPIRVAQLLLLPAVLVAYALVVMVGLMSPDQPMIAVGASIVVSLITLVVSVLWFRARTGWWRSLCIVLLVPVLAFPMIGAGNLGTDMALEQQADQVTGRVTDIDVEQVNHRRGSESFRTTYTFVATDDGRDLGTLEYRGDRGAHGLGIGDHAEVLADPSRELPVKLVEDVDSGRDISMLVLGGVLYLIGFVVGLAWPAVRARL